MLKQIGKFMTTLILYKYVKGGVLIKKGKYYAVYVRKNRFSKTYVINFSLLSVQKADAIEISRIVTKNVDFVNSLIKKLK